MIVDNTIEKPKKNKVCVYAITKNEEKFVDRWYESMKEADSIVVLDTGSTDRTVELLEKHGVTVKTEIIDPWRFDVARNKAMEMVPDDCNILLSTDLDEMLEPGWGDILREKWVEGKHTRACYKYTWSHLPDGSDGRVFRYNKIHNRDWEWRYPVHELLWHKDRQTEDYYDIECLDLWNEMHLHHYPDRTKSRGSYLPLLELRAELYKEDWYGLIYLAHEYYYRGHYDKSIALLNKILVNYADKYNEVEQASCYLFMGDSYRKLCNNAKAKECYSHATAIEPTYREPYLNKATILIHEKKYDEAYDVLTTAIKYSYRHYTWLERDTSWTYEPYDLLTLAAYYSGHKKESIAYAAIALSFCENDKRLKDNLRLCIENTSVAELVQR